MCPPQLLTQHLIRAHSVFLLLHDFTLDSLYERAGRSVFCGLLERFWDGFAWNWDILLSGNPAVDIFNGIKLSAGGELGVGVGEEQWGSGERAVLEDLVARTDGLVDLVVSRFGDAPTQAESDNQSNPTTDDKGGWLGSETHPQPSDGVVFAGIGAISRSALAQVSQWMEQIYKFGDNAYGVTEEPSSTRRRKHRKGRGKLQSRDASAPPPTKAEPTVDAAPRRTPDRPFSPGIPRPLVSGTPDRSQSPQKKAKSDDNSGDASESGGGWTDIPGIGPEKVMKYLTLGYGSSWSLWPQTLATRPRVSALKNNLPANTETSSEGDPATEDNQAKVRNDASGSFVFGLRGQSGNSSDRAPTDRNLLGSFKDDIVLRTLHTRLAASKPGDTTGKAIL